MRRPQAIRAQALGRQAERNRGLVPSILRMSGHREAEITIADWFELPVESTNTSDQTSGGAFYFTLGFSALGGGDVLR